MNVFDDYLKDLPPQQVSALRHFIKTVRQHVPQAEEGCSYGMPAFKYNGRPLIGFGSNQFGLSIYPFDPRVISEVKPELDGFDVGKGVVRFTPEHQVPDRVIVLMVETRLGYLQKK